MKKEELIKKAAERGITLNEEQAESYINLSDEELENLAVSGGCFDFLIKYDTPEETMRKKAGGCSYYEDAKKMPHRSCLNCTKFFEYEAGPDHTHTIYCQHMFG
ncbi:MAG: hypothetical protein LBL98_08040 [Ruminococcus sp.]|nr:hypothetical protein [Ruminococcus sp.]